MDWAGKPPQVEDFLYGVPVAEGKFDIRMMPNPNRPRIQPGSSALAGAVVSLHGISQAASKPWDLPPVQVEMADRQIVVKQGEGGPRRVGFVRRGESVTMQSSEPVFHILRGRGTAFFSLAFPDPGKTLTRVLEEAGRVELSSGAGYYWASADLFVDDLPYFTVTDAEGRFTFDLVPAGPVEVVVWLPGWTPARQERDPESGIVTRQTYTPTIEVKTKVRVEAGKSTTKTFTLP